MECVTKMAASVEENPKKKSQPQLVKLDRGFKLAEQWVNNMSKSSVNEKTTAVDLEGRPSRLGIGAAVPKASNAVTRSSDPIERKLLYKLNVGKRETNKRAEDLGPSVKEDDDSEEDESESKAKSFGKKMTPSLFSPIAKKSRR